MDYKSTLNLPKTDFPMKANLVHKEPIIAKQWADNKLYEQIQKQNQHKKKFILHDGPPYANGNIHIGHAINKILKDIIVKSKNLAGFYAPYIPGWDCHGLPIELNVEKKMGKVGNKIDTKTFREECRLYAEDQINKQMVDFKRLGVLADFANPYKTKDYLFEANIVRAFGQIIANNHLAKGYKPVHWCRDCSSSLADAEVEYNNKTSDAIDIAFKVIDDKFDGKEVYAVIWTTTPWTLPANEAVCVNSNFEYTLLAKQNKYYIVAKDLANTLSKKYGFIITNESISGKSLENTKLSHPFYDKIVPIVCSDHVSSDTGTGLVHIAPAHGQDDYIVAQQYNLPINNPVNDKSCFKEGVKFFANMFVFKANDAIIQKLIEANKLLNHSKIEHSYPHCWRHKTPLIFRTTAQWFIAMDNNNLRKNTLDKIKGVKWMPDWGEERINLMIASRPDWCVSRQRFWGSPLPLFIHKDTQKLHPNTNKIIERVASQIEKNSVDVWFDNDNKYFGVSDEYEKNNDTLDVWFDSGVSFFALLQQRKDLSYPADLYLEGSDQHRGWFQSSLLSSVAINNQAPYKQVLTHGFTVDGDGKKMSKSIGNVISPQKIVNSLGADILRFWVATTDYTTEMSVSDEIFKRSIDNYRRIRNIMRFMLANMHGFDFDSHHVGFANMLDLDKWILAKMTTTQKQIIKNYADYNFHNIIKIINNFITNELSGFYLDIIKDRLYTTKENSLARRSAQTVLYYLAHSLVRLISPILSFTAEEIWQHLPNTKNSVFNQEYFNLDFRFQSKAIDITKELSTKINYKIELMRKDKTVGSSLDCEVDIDVNSEQYNMLKTFGDELRFIFIVSAVRLRKADELAIKVSVSNNNKCVRCWHKTNDVGSDDNNKELCSRCTTNVFGDGEERKYC